MMAFPKILVANGVNMDLLGQRDPDQYGHATLKDIETLMTGFVNHVAPYYGFKAGKLHFFQSNDEAIFLDKISEPWDGIVLNPGAWTHTSLALADRLAALKATFVEVHLSNLASREPIRQHSYTAPLSRGIVWGMGEDAYLAGLVRILHLSA